jgi:hypothetical protein
MRFLLAAGALLMNALDNLTTLRCLSDPAPGFGVYEANPLAAWTFDAVGLRPGLAVEMVLSALAIAFLVYSKSFSLRLRMGILIAMVVLPAWAALNNWRVMQEMGLTLFG